MGTKAECKEPVPAREFGEGGNNAYAATAFNKSGKGEFD